MNHTIWKYTLEDTFQRQCVQMPAGAIVRHVDVQNGKICLWAQVHGMQSTTSRHFVIFGTGKELPASEVINDRLVFVGTFSLRPDAVGHLFEVLP